MKPNGGRIRSPNGHIKVFVLMHAPVGCGGAERLTLDILRIINRRRFEVTLVFLNGEGELAAAMGELGFPIIDLGAGRGSNIPGNLRAVVALRKLLRGARPDILHMHLPRAGVVGRFAARLDGGPCILYTEHSEPRAYAGVKRMLHLWSIRLLDHLVAVSGEIRDRILEETPFPAERLSLIYNGVDLRRRPTTMVPREQVRARMRVSADDKVALHVGRLAPQKDQQSLLQAARQVADELPEFRLVVAGKGPLEATLKQQADDLNLGDRVVFLGYRDDVLDLLSASDVFVLSSLWEGTSIALLEAMMMDTPAVVTDVGANTELVVHGETGVVVRPGCPSALAEGLLAVLRDPARARQMGEAARMRVETDFSIDRTVREYEALYERLVAGAGAGA